jgi:hypothetical protein
MSVQNGRIEAVKYLIDLPDITIDASIIESLPSNNPGMVGFLIDVCLARNINLCEINQSRVSLFVQLARGEYNDILADLVVNGHHLNLLSNDLEKV